MRKDSESREKSFDILATHTNILDTYTEEELYALDDEKLNRYAEVIDMQARKDVDKDFDFEDPDWCYYMETLDGIFYTPEDLPIVAELFAEVEKIHESQELEYPWNQWDAACLVSEMTNIEPEDLCYLSDERLQYYEDMCADYSDVGKRMLPIDDLKELRAEVRTAMNEEEKKPSVSTERE